ncbi:hypothetical protein IMZ48_11850 [Candidatus Bathyarchaeota archaeon]|nr:hypothetical protein [Candidatus Bathyarchaeota archaeon]
MPELSHRNTDSRPTSNPDPVSPAEPRGSATSTPRTSSNPPIRQFQNRRQPAHHTAKRSPFIMPSFIDSFWSTDYAAGAFSASPPALRPAAARWQTD